MSETSATYNPEVDDDFGPCCGCGAGDAVRNILMLDFLAPDGFSGWGCVICGLPNNGAIAVMCDACIADEKAPRFIAGGTYLADRVRVPLDDFLRVPFGHIHEKHPEMQ